MEEQKEDKGRNSEDISQGTNNLDMLVDKSQEHELSNTE